MKVSQVVERRERMRLSCCSSRVIFHPVPRFFDSLFAHFSFHSTRKWWRRRRRVRIQEGNTMRCSEGIFSSKEKNLASSSCWRKEGKPGEELNRDDDEKDLFPLLSVWWLAKGRRWSDFGLEVENRERWWGEISEERDVRVERDSFSLFSASPQINLSQNFLTSHISSTRGLSKDEEKKRRGTCFVQFSLSFSNSILSSFSQNQRENIVTNLFHTPSSPSPKVNHSLERKV